MSGVTPFCQLPQRDEFASDKIVQLRMAPRAVSLRREVTRLESGVRPLR